MKKIAALFADPRGVYSNRPGVDCWDERRDARKYKGPYPVVAHPPCARWCRLAKEMEVLWGLTVGDDGGCFKAALESVRRFGGILEHPAWSMAWFEHDLPMPARYGWQRGICGGWATWVEQGNYGHKVAKGTWLYVYGIVEPPALIWSPTDDHQYSWAPVKPGKTELPKKDRVATPPLFAEILLDIARMVGGKDGSL